MKSQGNLGLDVKGKPSASGLRGDLKGPHKGSDIKPYSDNVFQARCRGGKKGGPDLLYNVQRLEFPPGGKIFCREDYLSRETWAQRGDEGKTGRKRV